LHIYDNDKINNNIAIDLEKKPSEFTTISDEKIEITENILTIRDDSKIIAIAGIIGAKSSSCDDFTKNIIIEAGNFNPTNIAFSGRKLNILSESRHRFERGTDANNCKLAIDLATQMIFEICNTAEITISNDKITGQMQIPKIIDFDIKQIKKLIGIDIEKNKIIEILLKLGFEVRESNNILKLIVPSYRNDISIDTDIVEEIIRIHGFEHIINQELSSNFKQNSLNLVNSNKKNLDKLQNKNNLDNKIIFNNSANLNYFSAIIRQKLISKGLIETISWSFVEDKIVNLFYNKDESLFIKNPVSVEMNYLRPTLAIGLINSYKKNSLRNINNLSLFEIGNIFINNKLQKLSVSAIRIGKNKENNHYHDEREFDIFDIKQDLFSALEALNIKTANLEINTENPLRYFHPHRFASIQFGKNVIANFGELHPAINQKFNIKNRLNFFELFIDDNLITKKSNIFKSYTCNDFPIVERDFSFVVDENLAVIKLQKAITNIDKNLIKEVNIFDIFIGEQIGANKKSVALNIKIQAQKTLTSLEIEEISQKIITNLNQKFQATLRI
jgi:phenylalanyl-tRNA synthetase beta chain